MSRRLSDDAYVRLTEHTGHSREPSLVLVTSGDDYIVVSKISFFGSFQDGEGLEGLLSRPNHAYPDF
jgi:hypothetical protein